GGSLLGARENRLALFAQQLERAERDPAVRAVVLRVNSPGGTVTASDAMYQLLRRFRQRTGKPVIASCQEVCASGAYYVSCAADEIHAQPSSVVGSIGVIFSSFNLEGTLNLIGVKPEIVKSGPLKDMASPFKPMASEERQILQAMIDDYHRGFVAIVREARKLPDNPSLSETTDGRVFTGEQALARGLIDRLGMLEDALDRARELAGARGASAVIYKRPYSSSGSIYATQDVPPAQSGVLQLPVPEEFPLTLPAGFYYLWLP
ncbi:MAG: signal peptide peptidase SppA, partial [Phycisphaerae bacterium]|nr:signal peptide peptidase SppA [Phycisphaerae bacterium]